MKRDPLIRTERTVYGRKAGGKSQFVVIAPHAGGDDLRTGRLARHLAKLLDGAIVLNKKFYKHTNHKAALKPHFIEDFNELSWNKQRGEWRWFNRKLAMKIFYDDIAGYCDAIIAGLNRQPVCIYIHGLKTVELGIDIGMGLKSKNGKNRFVGSSGHGAVTGVPTIQIGQLKKMKQLLQEPIKKDYNLDIGVGNIYSAWDKRCGIQFHKCCGRNDYAIQLEIQHRLKETEENIAKLALLLAETFKLIFIN
ncbi:MAG: hypothetical protein V1928_05585 [Parcubacteria group bacterium]